MPDLRNSSFRRRVERSMQGADHRANRLGCIVEFGARLFAPFSTSFTVHWNTAGMISTIPTIPKPIPATTSADPARAIFWLFSIVLVTSKTN